MKSNNRKIGDKGEDIACFYLEKHGFLIQERNHLRKWGEIDIIAVKDGILHFIEVKSVIDKGNTTGYRPEENVHSLKQRKLRRVIQTYLNEHKYNNDADFKFHVITVMINPMTGKSKVKMFNNIIL
jgi:putative endonuclease